MFPFIHFLPLHLQRRNDELTPGSHAALEEKRVILRGGGDLEFAEAVDRCREAVSRRREQNMRIKKVKRARGSNLQDGFYIFRASCVGSGGWQFHAVACDIIAGTPYWSENVAKVFEGYKVNLEDGKKRKQEARDEKVKK